MIKINGEVINPTIFPDGTSQMWKFNWSSGDHIEFEYENEAEVMQLFQILDFYNEQKKYIPNTNTYVTLAIPYLPYARQDKSVRNPNETFALHTFLTLLDSFGRVIDGIEVLDVHNKDALGDRAFINKNPTKEIRDALIGCSPTLICFPDLGAKKRYSKMEILEDFPSCSLTKDRNQETGYITNLFLNELVGVEGEDILIIDDICDGGMTFILTAEKLLTLGAKSVNLYTTHGIYSKGIGPLKAAGISKIFNRKGEVK